MAKSKTTPKTPLTPSIQAVKENIETALEHHKKFRVQCGQLYNYHDQMVTHLEDQLNQMERSEKS